MSEYTIALLAVVLLGYALVAGRLSHTIITGPIIFAVLGVVLGPEMLGWVDFAVDTQLVETVLSVTLGLALFSDATRIDFAELLRSFTIPARLLAFGLPLTIALGALSAWALFPELGLWAAALVAAILAPTDAALGEAVVSNRRVPVRIRQSLGVESGLNDGIALPFVTVFLVVVESEGETAFSGRLLLDTLIEDLGIGLLVGVAVGALAAVLVARASRSKWLESPWVPVAGVATPALAFGVTEPLGGSGFVATFVAGAAFSIVARSTPEAFNDLTEELDKVLVPLTFLIFGGSVLTAALGHLDWRIVVFVVLSLTVVRMAPTGVALTGTGLRPRTVLFSGWFGPRGLASILFLVIIVEEAGPFDGLGRLNDVVAWTVAASIIAHGVTAWPWSNRYADWIEQEQAAGTHLAELESPPDIRTG